MRHINFFLVAQNGVFWVGAKKFMLKKFMCFSGPLFFRFVRFLQFSSVFSISILFPFHSFPFFAALSGSDFFVFFHFFRFLPFHFQKKGGETLFARTLLRNTDPFRPRDCQSPGFFGFWAVAFKASSHAFGEPCSPSLKLCCAAMNQVLPPSPLPPIPPAKEQKRQLPPRNEPLSGSDLLLHKRIGDAPCESAPKFAF